MRAALAALVLSGMAFASLYLNATVSLTNLNGTFSGVLYGSATLLGYESGTRVLFSLSGNVITVTVERLELTTTSYMNTINPLTTVITIVKTLTPVARTTVTIDVNEAKEKMLRGVSEAIEEMIGGGEVKVKSERARVVATVSLGSVTYVSGSAVGTVVLTITNKTYGTRMNGTAVALWSFTLTTPDITALIVFQEVLRASINTVLDYFVTPLAVSVRSESSELTWSIKLISNYVFSAIDAIKNFVNMLFTASSRSAWSPYASKTLVAIQATWAMGNNATVLGPNAFDYCTPVLIISLRGNPAIPNLVIDHVDVLYAGRVVCHYNAFALSADASDGSSYAVQLFGYVGEKAGEYDDADVLIPGGIAVNVTNVRSSKSALRAGDRVSVTFNELDDFATATAGVWTIMFVSANRVESAFERTSASLEFVERVGTLNGAGKEVPLFDLLKVGRGDWSLVIWCRYLNPHLMNSVDVRIQFQDGSTWQTAVPLIVQ